MEESLFEVKTVDEQFYRDEVESFLPSKIIDVHTHIWLKQLLDGQRGEEARTVSWPSRVAEDNSVEDLLETYRIMFPGKTVTPLVFAIPPTGDDLDALNSYVQKSSTEHDLPALLFLDPTWPADEFEERMVSGGFLGAKSYLTTVPQYLPAAEIRIFDYFPHHQLEVMDRHGWIMMLHIPRPGRLGDPVNLAQMVEIEQQYPGIELIIAHVGRAYCNEDAGDAFNALSHTEKMLFDFSANTNQWVFEQLIETVGPKRILFGSDMPILRMRTRRVCENGVYINIVPKGLYGDVSGDPHLREADSPEADSLTFFMYEEIAAFKRAAENRGLTRTDIEDIFYNNAHSMIERTRGGPVPV